MRTLSFWRENYFSDSGEVNLGSCVCVCHFWSACVLSKLLWKRTNLFLTYLISTRSKSTKPQAEFIIQEEEVEMHTSRNKSAYTKSLETET